MKKTLLVVINLILLVIVVSGIVILFKDKVQNSSVMIKNDSDKMLIVTTLFPEYDFVKQIVGDKADVSLI